MFSEEMINALIPLFVQDGNAYATFLHDSYDRVISPSRKYKKRRLNLRYTDIQDFDAFSVVENGQDVIAISNGLIKAIFKYAEMSLPRASVFSFEDKAMLTMHLALMAQRYIIGHEAQHLYAGHNDYLQTLEGRSSRLGVAYDAATGLPMTDFQTLEMNADCGAACRLVDINIDPDTSPQFFPDKVCPLIDLEPDGRLRNLMRAINIVFYALRHQEEMRVIPYIDEYTHPPSYMRQIMNLNTVKKYLSVEYGIDRDFNFFVDCLGDDDKSILQASGLIISLAYYKKSLDDEVIKHEALLRGNWLTLKGKLDPYTRIPHAEFVN